MAIDHGDSWKRDMDRAEAFDETVLALPLSRRGAFPGSSAR